MDFIQHDSGLVFPVEQQPKPAPKYGVLEIQDEAKRKLAKEALSMLWDALDLSDGQAFIVAPEHQQERREAHWNLYYYVGNLLLGDDLPEKEVLT